MATMFPKLVRSIHGMPTVVGNGARALSGLRQLSEEQLASYHRDGFLFVRKMFNEEEVGLLLETVKEEPAVNNKVMKMTDNSGLKSKLVLWSRPGDDLYGMFARGQRWTGVAQDLIGTEPYHFHTKLMMKEPRVGGAWEWHQDFAYWFLTGCLNPDQMFSSILAIDPATKANGCLQVLKGTHKLGRLPHGATGAQAGMDPVRLEQCLERHELIYCEMDPGDVLFTHSNLLHTSAPNESDNWRRSMIVAYNGKDNEPWPHPNWTSYEPLQVVSDDAIIQTGVRTLDPDRDDFLDEKTNEDSFAVEVK